MVRRHASSRSSQLIADEPETGHALEIGAETNCCYGVGLGAFFKRSMSCRMPPRDGRGEGRRPRAPRQDRRRRHRPRRCRWRVAPGVRRGAADRDGRRSGRRAASFAVAEDGFEAARHVGERRARAPERLEARCRHRKVPARPPAADGERLAEPRRDEPFCFEPIERRVERAAGDAAGGSGRRAPDGSAPCTRSPHTAGWRAAPAAPAHRGTQFLTWTAL